MRKNIILSIILSCSMLISAIPAAAAGTVDDSKKQENTDAFSVIRNVPYMNEGLIHYEYQDEDGNNITLESGKKPATISRKKAAALPSSYSSVTDGITTSIKDQGYTGACWAFAATKVMETSAILKGLSPQDSTDLSESHLAWYAYHGETDSASPIYGDNNLEYDPYEDTYSQGGSALLAATTMMNWWGMATEEDAPFTADTESGLRSMISSMKAKDNSFRYRSVLHLKEANCYDNADLSTIKQAVMDYNAMSVSLYYDTDNIYNEDGEYSYYQTTYDGDSANHAVTIVGWDDDFDKFSKAPKAKGAWLIANSYGESQEPLVTRDGYFWVSYYEPSLSEFYTLEAEAADTYDTNYQYDGIGYNTGIGLPGSIACANVFTNTTGKKQAVTAAGIYTLTDNQAYKISVYRKIAGTKPNTGKLAKSTVTSGVASYSGYHTVPLANATNIEPGEKFAIVVEYEGTDSNQYSYIPVEGSEEDMYGYYLDSKGRVIQGKFTEVSSKTGQSFIYSNNTWNDTTSLKINTGSFFGSSYQTENYHNVCVKAFASNHTVADDPDDLVDVSGGDDNNTGVVTVTPAASKYTIGKGERVTLSCTLSDVDQLTFSSSNTSIAVIESTGIITGVAPGTATILLETASGGTAKVTVVVKKAPSKVTASVSKKTMKKGKTQKVKVKLPSGSASYRITYKSSKKSVATISKKGVIKAKKKGTAKITVTTFNNKKCTFKIKVKK